MKIYTRTGDRGTTALFGGDRVSKTHPRIVAYGTVDELNSYVGLVRAQLDQPDDEAHSRSGFDVFDRMMAAIQRDLFVLGADLATPEGSRAQAPRIAQSDVDRLEQEIDRMEVDLEPLKRFILPGGSTAGATLHVARTVCRRAERLVLEAEGLSELAAVYLNRLSDLFFVAARWTNKQLGAPENEWDPSSSADGA